MQVYLNLLSKVLKEGKMKDNRTGVPALTISGAILEHHMKDGFPLITTKKMAFETLKVELEFFLKGITDKAWLQERGCKIWDEWCNPTKIPVELKKPGREEERKEFQLNENDLGKVYGYQWNNFNGVNQLHNLVDTLKKDPNDRRMIVSAWNPGELHEMALPPCHILFHVTVIDNELNLTWFQRSCDLALGIPFNLASYALLLHLLAQESGFEEGKITGMLSDIHIYESHIPGVNEQLEREPLPLGRIETDFTSIWDWEHQDSRVVDYHSLSRISFPISV